MFNQDIIQKDTIQEQLEQEILSIILTNPGNSKVERQLETLSESDFTIDYHKQIIKLAQDQVKNKKKIDGITIRAKIEDEDLQKYLVFLASNATGMHWNLESYIENLIQLRQRKELELICKSYLEDCQNKELDINQIKYDLLQDTENLIKSSRDESTKEDWVDLRYKLIEKAEQQVKISTGIKVIDDLDCFYGGFAKGELIGICGQAKSCKTTLASTIAYNMTKAGKKILFIACEQSPIELARKMIGRELGKTRNQTVNHIRESQKDPNKMGDLVQSLKHQKDTLIFEEAPGINFIDLQKMLHHYIYKEKIDGFVLDYYQLVTGQKNTETEAQHLKNVIYWLQKIVRKNPKTMGIVLAQLNDEGKARGSRDIVMACDAILKIKKEENSIDDLYSLSSIAVRNGAGFDLQKCFKNINGTHLQDVASS